MNSWKVILAAVVIFGAGVLTGGLLDSHVVHEHRPISQPRSPELWRKKFVGHLDKTLHLTPEQHVAISKIVIEGQKGCWKTWRQEMAHVYQRIRVQLTPKQQKKFDEMEKRFSSHHPQYGQKPSGSPSSTNRAPPPQAGGTTGP